MSSLHIDGVHKAFGSHVALDGISLEVEDGELLVLLGPSGCGKSTLLRVIAGLSEPDSGRVLIDGEDVTTRSPSRRDVAMVFQSYALYPHLSVRRNLAFGLRARKVERAELAWRVAEVAAQLGLEGLLDRRPRELSGGQRQRVALGRAMVRDPKAFLMDEPLSNLDPQLRSTTRDEIVDLQRRLGATFVYVTHDQVEAMAMAHRIAVMRDGRIEQVGTPEQVYETPATTFVSQFVGSPPMNLIEAEIASRDGILTAIAPDVVVSLWPGSQAPRRVLIGIRPEHLVPLRGPGNGIAARVRAVENLGHEEILRCELGARPLLARGARPVGIHPGERVMFGVDPSKVAFFDPDSGRRLAWVADDVSLPPAPAPADAVRG